MAILEAPCAQNAPGRSTMRPPEGLLPRNPTWESSHFSGLTNWRHFMTISVSLFHCVIRFVIKCHDNLRQFTTVSDIFCPVPILPSPFGFRRLKSRCHLLRLKWGFCQCGTILVAPYRAILRYYCCDRPYRAILLRKVSSPPNGARPPLGT